MDLIVYIIMGVFVVFVAIMSLRQGRSERGKSLERRREELYEYSQQRLDEEFRKPKPAQAAPPAEDDRPEEG